MNIASQFSKASVLSLNHEKPDFLRNSFLMLLLILCLIAFGCSSIWTPSDDEIIRLVKDHYLFFNSGESIAVKALTRKEYLKDCECYPIDITILRSGRNIENKTFYIHKNREGDLEIKRYKSGVKNSATY